MVRTQHQAWHFIRENICAIIPLTIIFITCSTSVYYADPNIWSTEPLTAELTVIKQSRQLRFITTKSKSEAPISTSPNNIKNVISAEPSAPLERIAARQVQRKTLIEATCAKHAKAMAQRGARSWKMKLNTRNKYLLCPIPKSGWSSWKRLWFYTSGIIDSYDTDVGIKKDTAAGIKDITSSMVSREWQRKSYNYSFVFFRNPWDRLVSAYINKAVEYNYSRILHTPCRHESMNPYKADLTFKQFLYCIADGSEDMHWTPQWRLCNVCQIKFDFIGHLDTVHEDAAHVIQEIGLNVTYPHSFASKLKKSNEEWYKDLPSDLLSRLKKRYEYDFDLHGWDPQPPGRTDV